jgi:hypothetical protein
MARTPKSTTPNKPHAVWLCVFEVAYADIPTRFAGKPHVKIEQKALKPGDELNAWLKRARAKKRPELVRVRDDLMPAAHDPGGLHAPFEYPRDEKLIERALRKLRENLRCVGFTIGKSQDLWHVYAIELNDDHLAKRRKPAGYRGHVYVGQTSLPVEERVRQHELGNKYPWKGRPKHSKDCHRYFRRYAPQLVPPELRGPIACKRQALRFERDLRRRLERQGYRVIGGTELLPKKKGKNDEPR